MGSGREKPFVEDESISRISDDYDLPERLPRVERPDSPERVRPRSPLVEVLRSAARVLAWMAILGSAALLLSDAAPQLSVVVKFVAAMARRAWALLDHAPLSALPLLLVGGAYIALQGLLRPAPLELLKRLMLGSAFLLWGIVQLMPPGVLATQLGDLVIALYVLDLGIIIEAELREV
jgi:hypothetical protein